MKIVFVSDTHGSRPPSPPGSLLIHCGDAAGTGSVSELARFNEWCQAQRLLYPMGVVHVPGNHDKLAQTDSTFYRSMLPGVHVLIDEMVIIDGKVIYGSPWTPFFNNWYFQLTNEEQARRIWDRMPEYVDVLVTHGPPRGILDKTDDGREVGCPYLMERVLQVKPQIHAFGHIHESYGQQFFNGTQFINASHMNGDYRPTNAPIVVELE